MSSTGSGRHSLSRCAVPVLTASDPMPIRHDAANASALMSNVAQPYYTPISTSKPLTESSPPITSVHIGVGVPHRAGERRSPTGNAQRGGQEAVLQRQLAGIGPVRIHTRAMCAVVATSTTTPGSSHARCARLDTRSQRSPTRRGHRGAQRNDGQMRPHRDGRQHAILR